MLAGDALVRFLRGHTKAITGHEVLNDPVFRAVPELRLISKYGVGAYPESFVVDRRGRIAATRRGPVDDDFIRSHVLPLLREPS